MKRMKSIITVLLVGLLICIGSDKETTEIRITCSSWDEQSDWDPNYKRPEVEKNYTVSTGDVIDITGNGWGWGLDYFTVRIVSISNDKVVIRTNMFMSDSTDGTIDMNSMKTKFVIDRGEKIKLTTLSKGGGNIYLVELVPVP